MRLGKFTKTPTEAKRYKIDYSHWLDASEYVSAVSFSTISTNIGLINCIAGPIGATDTTVTFFATGGTDGQTYEVAVTMTTSGNQIKQDVIYFIVKSIPVT